MLLNSPLLKFLTFLYIRIDLDLELFVMIEYFGGLGVLKIKLFNLHLHTQQLLFV